MAAATSVATRDSLLAIQLQLLELGAGEVPISSLLDLPQHTPPSPSIAKDSALAWTLTDSDLSIARDAAFAHSLAQAEMGHSTASSSASTLATSSDGAGPASRPTVTHASKTARADSVAPPLLPDIAVPPFTCGICLELSPISLRFPPAECGHAFCMPCMRQHLVVVATDTQQYPFPCPACPRERGRQAMLEPETCLRALAGTGTPYRALERLLLESQHASRLCYCANKKCSEPFDFVQVAGPGGEPGETRATCPACGVDTCVDCRVVWHEGQSCEQYRSDKTGDGLLLKLAERKKWRACPKCKVHIDKAYGCNHMTCRCGHTFCYSCGRSSCTCGRR